MWPQVRVLPSGFSNQTQDIHTHRIKYMTGIESQAFENFSKHQTLWTVEQEQKLKRALDEYIVAKPSVLLKEYLDAHPFEPLQVVRDRKIVDHMYEHQGMTQEDAINIWADWEDYEYEIRKETGLVAK